MTTKHTSKNKQSKSKQDTYTHKCTLQIQKPLKDSTYIVFDLEATGGNPQKNALTEVCALKVKQGKITNTFHSLINPQMPIPEIVSGITGITNKMVKEAPLIDTIMPEFLDFIGEHVLVSHNAQGDMKFLRYVSLKTCHKQLKNFYLCTHLLLIKLFPQTKNKTLKGAVRHFNIPTAKAHRAEGDARMTADLFQQLLQELERRDIKTIASAIREQGDTESGIKVGWALEASNFKSLPTCPAVVRFFDRERRLIFKQSYYNLAKDIRALTRYKDLPRPVLRNILRANSMQTRLFPNLYAAMLWEQQFQEGENTERPAMDYQRNCTSIYFCRENNDCRVNIGEIPPQAHKAYGLIENRTEYGKIFKEISAILRVKLTRHGMLLTQNEALLVEFLLRAELAQKSTEFQKTHTNKLTEFFKSVFLNKTTQGNIEKLQEINLPNPLQPLLDIFGLVVVLNYTRTSWQLYPIAHSIPLACFETNQDWREYLYSQKRYLSIHRQLLLHTKKRQETTVMQNCDIINATIWWILSSFNKQEKIFLNMKELKSFTSTAKTRN